MRIFFRPLLLPFTILVCLFRSIVPSVAQECEVVAHVVEKSNNGTNTSLVMLSSGTSTKYSELMVPEGDRGFFGEKYYVTIEMTDDNAVTYRYYSTANWSSVATVTQSRNENSDIISVVYSPADELVYSVEKDKTSNTYTWHAATMDDFMLDPVSDATHDLSRAYYAMCATKDGTVYGFATDAGLYKITPHDGSEEKLFVTGSVGLDGQSAWIDEEQGIIYRAVSSSIGTTIYSYNLVAKTEKFVKIYTSFSAIVAMAADNFVADSSKPIAVQNVTVSKGESLNHVLLSFTAPGVDINGNELTDSLLVSIAIDGEQVDELQVQPLAECVLSYELTDGLHIITVVVSNEYGISEAVDSQVFAGYDIPQPVKRVTISCDFPYIDIWWSSPVGIHNEVIDIDNVRYRVTRYPDNVLIADTTATTVQDSLPSIPYMYKYGVVAYLPDYTTAERYSSPFSYECAMFPPCHIACSDTALLGAYVIDDANADGATWGSVPTASGGAALRYLYSAYNRADDYLYFPTMNMQENVIYEAVIYLRAGSDKYAEQFSVGVISEEDNGYNDMLIEQETIISKSSTPYKVAFKIPERGDYRLYIHCSSPANHHLLYVDSLSVQVREVTATPQPVDALTLVADEAHPAIVNVACHAPVRNEAGALLGELERVIIYRNGEPLHTCISPVPGEKIMYRDSVPVLDRYTYEIVAVNEQGTSRPVTGSIVRGVAEFPYSHNFVDGIGFFTTVDNNHDGATWHFYEDRYMGCMRYLSSESNDADDWLITPPIYLSSSMRYQVEYGCCVGHSHYPESMRVMLGRTPHPNAMSRVIDNQYDFTFISDTCLIAPFDIPVTGIYHLAFQAVSPADSYAILLRNMRVCEYDPLSVQLPLSASWTARGGEGCIVVDAREECDVVFYTLDGIEVNRVITPAGTWQYNMSHGMYVVAVGTERVKVVVR